MKMRCSVPNCTNDTKRITKNHGITFHLFPKEPNLRTSWIDALGLIDWEPKERSGICSEHFRNEDLYETKCGLKRIKNGAVPFVSQLSAEELNASAVLRVCRICLEVDTKMYELKDHNLDVMFQQVTGVNLNNEDKLPQKLCWECAHRLTTSYKFRSKALRSQELMMEILQTTTYITVRDIKSINRYQHNIKSSLIHKNYDPEDYDMLVNENEVIKPENKRDSDIKEEGIEGDGESEVEVKNEDIENNEHNEIFFEEFDGFDDDDDRKLSEISEEVCVKKPKVKKRKLKAEKVRKPVVRKKSVEVDGSPSTTMNKYKHSDVKRRKTLEAIDENLFTICNLSYDEQIAEIHKRQDTTAYKHAPFKCTICYRGFQIKDRYDVHVVRHSEQCGAFECFICKTRLKTGRALRKHITAQHTEQYSCKGCPFVTRNRGVAREHEKWHAGTKYQCPQCPCEFDKLTTYMGHIRIKHVSDFVCELCGYTFVSKKGIEVHKKKKHRLADKNVLLEGPYCDVCDVTFISEDAHARHLKLSSRHSSDNDPNRIRNDSQSMNTEKNGRIVRKIERRPVIHPRDPDNSERRDTTGPVTCEQCGMQLRDLRLYAQHFRRAHPDKNRTKYPAMKTPCMCEQCGRIFQSMALLKDHMWVHTGEKRFKCDRCEKSFTQKTNLVFHMRVHSASRPTYECPLCGKHFAFYNNRRRHMFIHTGLKPFKCDTCGKCFTTSGEQRAHIEHVHLKKPWPKRARARHMAQGDGDWQKCGMEHMED